MAFVWTAADSGTVTPGSVAAGAGSHGMSDDPLRFVCIVARDQPELYEHLRARFEGDPSIQVIFDRREGERRQPAPESECERRRAHRRWHPDNRDTLSAVGVFMVPLTESA